MKITSTCLAAALFAWMTSGAAWACDSGECNTDTPPQAEERIAGCESGACNTETLPEAVIGCVGTCDNTETQPQTEAKAA